MPAWSDVARLRVAIRVTRTSKKRGNGRKGDGDISRGAWGSVRALQVLLRILIQENKKTWVKIMLKKTRQLQESWIE
jgi:hypothetical protein